MRLLSVDTNRLYADESKKVCANLRDAASYGAMMQPRVAFACRVQPKFTICAETVCHYSALTAATNFDSESFASPKNRVVLGL